MLVSCLGFGLVARVAHDCVHVGAKTRHGWMKFESTLGGAENLYEQLGAALGYGLNAGERLRLAELEKLLTDAKDERRKLLKLESDLTQVRDALRIATAVAQHKETPAPTAPRAAIKVTEETVRPMFEAWKASDQFLLPYLRGQGLGREYTKWLQRFRFRMHDEFTAHIQSLLKRFNKTGKPKSYSVILSKNPGAAA